MPDRVFALMPTTDYSALVSRRSPTTVAAAGWLVPGAGYLLLGDRARGLTVGITVVVLFVGGLLIGGVRVLEVPGYGPHGRPLETVVVRDRQSGLREDVVEETSDENQRDLGWVMRVHPIDEIRNKPWSIAQVMAGPLAVAAGAGAVMASERDVATGLPVGARSHARVNEIGVLYTAIAGMLNLLAIIDASHRAAQGSPQGAAQ
jgi:hypothetical protein